VGKLVRRCQELGLPLAQLTADLAAPVAPDLPAEVLAALDPLAASQRKQSPGGTGPGPVGEQIAEIRALAARAREQAAAVPRLDTLFARLRQAEI
jgi:argininosuccinate lyase